MVVVIVLMLVVLEVAMVLLRWSRIPKQMCWILLILVLISVKVLQALNLLLLNLYILMRLLPSWLSDGPTLMMIERPLVLAWTILLENVLTTLLLVAFAMVTWWPILLLSLSQHVLILILATILTTILIFIKILLVDSRLISLELVA